MDSGVIGRLRVTPASRLALLLGTVLRDVVMFAVPAVVVIAIAIPFGFHARWGGLALLLLLLAGLTAPDAYGRSWSVRIDFSHLS